MARQKQRMKRPGVLKGTPVERQLEELRGLEVMAEQYRRHIANLQALHRQAGRLLMARLNTAGPEVYVVCDSMGIPVQKLTGRAIIFCHGTEAAAGSWAVKAAGDVVRKAKLIWMDEEQLKGMADDVRATADSGPDGAASEPASEGGGCVDPDNPGGVPRDGSGGGNEDRVAGDSAGDHSAAADGSGGAVAVLQPD